MTPRPRFSIIIPNYNNAPTLARAIDSALAQTFAAHEIIVIDDGSTDDSRAVCERYGARVRYSYQDNAGVSAARNHGAAIATGDWFAFLDADDAYYPLRLQVHADWIAREPDIDFLLGDQEFRKPDGEFMHLAIDNCSAGRKLIARHAGSTQLPMHSDDFEEFIADGFAEIRSLSLPAATFHALGGFTPGMKIGEDLHLVVRLCARSRKAGVVHLPLAIYYIFPNSALRSNVLKAQLGFVASLEALCVDMAGAAPGIRRGCTEKLRSARLNLSYSYLREGRRADAVRNILPLLRNPGLRSLRAVLSIVRGLPPGERRVTTP
ncbi:MAG: glycosyltransferase family 2 protein [Telluria sp.]